MKRLEFGVWGLAMAVALASVPATGRAQDIGIEVGAVAPGAALETLDGKATDIGQFIGKQPVLLEFWATWCPNCAQLEPHMKAMHAKYGKQVAFVSVAVTVNQSLERVKLYVDKHQIPWTTVWDRKGNAAGAYDAPATSYVVIVNQAGKVVYTGLGGKQDLEPALRKAASGK